ncbi:MAG TPA: hypothetical protein VMC41_01060 [Candidatus Nanoarchaeia archaeon]|nr:hypothetical protein [Candidatus Nanoarchaeia archaeon]
MFSVWRCRFPTVSIIVFAFIAMIFAQAADRSPAPAKPITVAQANDSQPAQPSVAVPAPAAAAPVSAEQPAPQPNAAKNLTDFEKRLDNVLALFKARVMAELPMNTVYAVDSIYLYGRVRHRLETFNSNNYSEVYTDSTSVYSFHGKIGHGYYRGGEKIKIFSSDSSSGTIKTPQKKTISSTAPKAAEKN